MASLSLSLTSAPHLRFITYRSYTNCPTCCPDSDSAHPFPLPLIVSPELSEASFRPGAAGAGEGGGCQPSRRAPGTRPLAGGAAAGSRRCPIGAGQPAGGSRVSRGLIPRALARADTRRCVSRPPPCVWRRREGEPMEFLCHRAAQVAL